MWRQAVPIDGFCIVILLPQTPDNDCLQNGHTPGIQWTRGGGDCRFRNLNSPHSREREGKWINANRPITVERTGLDEEFNVGIEQPASGRRTRETRPHAENQDSPVHPDFYRRNRVFRQSRIEDRTDAVEKPTPALGALSPVNVALSRVLRGYTDNRMSNGIGHFNNCTNPLSLSVVVFSTFKYSQ